jgi:hypothetical protein
MGGGKESTIKKLGTRKGKVDRKRWNDGRGRERYGVLGILLATPVFANKHDSSKLPPKR